MKNISQLKIGSLLSYIQMFLGVIISLLYTPAMLELLGQYEYGLYNTVASTISMLSLLSMGFNSGYIRYYSLYKKINDKKSIWKLNGLFLIVFIIIGFVALLCGIFLSLNLELVFSTGLSNVEYATARLLMQLLTINLAISFPMSVFSNIISANERFIFLKAMGIIKTVSSPLITLPLLIMGFRSIAMVSVTLVLTIITDLTYMYYVINKLKNKFIFKEFEKGIFINLFSYTSFIAINMFVDQINWNVDKVLLGRYVGTAAVAKYSVGYTLFQHYMMISTSISSVFTPKIHRIVEETNENRMLKQEKLTELFIKVGRIQFILLGLCATGFIFFGKNFIMNIWAGEEYFESYYVTALLVISSSIALIQNIGIEIQRAQNKHRFRAVVYAFMSILNLLISINLCRRFGAIGSALGTAVSLVIANGVIMNYYYHYSCNVDIVCFWKSIAQLSRGLILPLVFGYIVISNMQYSGVVVFVFSIVLYIIIYSISMWIWGMNNYEKKLIIVPITKVMRKND